MPSFNIDISERPDDIMVVKLAGFLDAHTFQEFEKELSGLYDQKKVRVVVDLTELEYISSAGAGVFIGHIGNYQEAGGNIVLMSPRENVKDVFDLLGLSQIFQFGHDEESSFAHFS
jgi:anti-anti-sigma factor